MRPPFWNPTWATLKWEAEWSRKLAIRDYIVGLLMNLHLGISEMSDPHHTFKKGTTILPKHSYDAGVSFHGAQD